MARAITATMWKGALIALGYGTVSISITLFNKAVFDWYDFRFSNTLTLGQMVFALLALRLLRRSGLVQFPDLEVPKVRQVMPLSFFFIAMVVTGLAGLVGVNVPMYGALRRATTWIVLLLEQLVLGRSKPWDEATSVHVMIVGAFVGALGDLTFNFWGYFVTGLNCVVTAFYLVYIPKKSKETGLNDYGLMYYNNVLSLPIVVLLVLMFDFRGLTEFERWNEWGFWVAYLSSVVQAFLLNYFIFSCSNYNSPLVTSVTGQLKNIVQTAFGLFLFGDVIPTRLLLTGLTISTLASLWYGQIKYQQLLGGEDLKRRNAATADDRERLLGGAASSAVGAGASPSTITVSASPTVASSSSSASSSATSGVDLSAASVGGEKADSRV